MDEARLRPNTPPRATRLERLERPHEPDGPPLQQPAEAHDAKQHPELVRHIRSLQRRSSRLMVHGNSVWNDGFVWRKYGEKSVHGFRYRRDYFKCAEHDCQARKTVQGCDADNSWFTVTYTGEHTCQSSKNADNSSNNPLTADNLKAEVVNEHPENSSKHFHLINSEDDEGLVSLHSELSAESACTTLSSTSVISLKKPMESPHGVQVLLKLENTKPKEFIFVGVVVHALPSEFLVFHFFDAKDMSLCVGVGLPQARVMLHNDLNITIEETAVTERELKDTWMPLLSNNNRHLVMKVKWEVPTNRDDHVQTLPTVEGETLSRLYGVGFDCGSHYVDETYDAAEVSWPLLYYMALFILTTNNAQCNDTNGESSSAQGASSFQGNIQCKTVVDKLRAIFNNLVNRGNFQDGGGDGNEDGFSGNADASEDDDPPIVLKVTVHPLTKCDILGTQVKPYRLDGASIAPKLVFEFRRNRECKRICIKTQTRLELVSHMDVYNNANLFGWYHTGIQISFGCVDGEGHPESGRVALLKQNSCRILNPRASYKYVTTKSIVSSEADTYTRGGQAGFKLSSSWLGGMELQGSSSGSRTQQVATNTGGNIEVVRECICEGFCFKDCSSTEFPARASFLLLYPLENVDIWGDKEFLQVQGVCSTIEPSIEGTWIPLNGLDASPYLFKVVRSLKFHIRNDGGKDYVQDYKQEYVLDFYVNHAMSHLKSQRSKPIELFGDQQFVPNVLQVGSVY